jgi:hypothetical protein
VLSTVGGHVLILHMRLRPLRPRQFLHDRLHASDKQMLFNFGELVTDASRSKPPFDFSKVGFRNVVADTVQSPSLRFGKVDEATWQNTSLRLGFETFRGADLQFGKVDADEGTAGWSAPSHIFEEDPEDRHQRLVG